MCGIVGLHLKNAGLEACLGELVVPMLDVLASRGPDSTGVAIYSRDVSPGEVKYSLCAPEADYTWAGYAAELENELGSPVALRRRGRDAVVVSQAPSSLVISAIARIDDRIRLFGHGTAMEVYKDVGPAIEVCARYGVSTMTGHQAIGHTRMATESAVTIEHSHPFAAGPDLALVHNGSFSNHASIRRDLADLGVSFDTDNDSEVAARFIDYQMSQGSDLADAMRGVLKSFDGFFTLVVATEDSIAVVRDSFACKPMVVAETADYVALASEYIALADLPGIEKADVFEPMPEELYTWPT
jgi:methylamine---glutamate N-methyltransferase subunit A